MTPVPHLWLVGAAATLGIGLGVFFDGAADWLAVLLLLPGPVSLLLPLRERREDP